ncbi:MAG: crotonase/enoyl-CoA hydratase family protein [Deltaproteobacteria bacterium]|nr:crotonase/enoyl-CoA hydratase family protein [Deltaproteobacteria bacterium]
MSAVSPYIFPSKPSYKHISTRFDSQYGALWCFLDPKPRACFTFEVLTELRSFAADVERMAAEPEDVRRNIRYFVVASKTPGVFNLGGDLALFARCVTERDEETLRKYAHACIDTLYQYVVAFRLPILTISLVQGDAMGGGFELALGGDVLVAEHGAQMGFPEVMFNLFPGMGAYNLLHRRIGIQRTERMLLNGKLYRAEELHAEGVVDILAEAGRGENAVYEYIVRNAGRQNAHEAVRKVRRRLFGVSFEQLQDVTEIWVDTAMRIGPREVRLMERLARSQERVALKAPSPIGPRGVVSPVPDA